MGTINLDSPVVVGILTAIPFALLFILALRGRLALDDPYCAECGHSLRGQTAAPAKCAECGTPFKRIGSVRFARRTRRPRWIAIAAVLLLFVPSGAVAATLWWRSSKPAVVAPAAGRPTRARAPVSPPPTSLPDASFAELLDSFSKTEQLTRVPGAVWNELAERVRKDSLSEAEIARLVTAMSTRFQSSDYDGFGLCTPIIMSLATQGRITEAQAAALYERLLSAGSFSITPRVTTDAKASVSWAAFDYPLDSSRAGIDESFLGPFRVRRLTALRIDGAPVEISYLNEILRLPPLASGEHAVEFDYETVFILLSQSEYKKWSTPNALSKNGTSREYLGKFFPDDGAEDDATWRKLASGRETRRDSITARGPDEALVEPLEPRIEEAQSSALRSGLRVERAVIRPIGGPGEQTIQVRVVWTGGADVRMLARLVVRFGDRVIASEPRVMQLGQLHRTENAPPPTQTIFEIDQVIESLPSSVGRLTATIEPVATIPGKALWFERGLTTPVELAPVDLKRTDLGE